ncbi:hypothetical protein BKI52_39590 [marine bacterium AO1-C]|nr:hypothetical protein BKI52_39590 [marine bacterium AO1-C]
METSIISDVHVAFVSHVFHSKKTPEELLEEYFTIVEWVTAIFQQGVKVSVIYRYSRNYQITKEGVHYYFIADKKATNSKSNPGVFYRDVKRLLTELEVNVVHLHNIRDIRTNIRLKRVFSKWPMVIQDHGSVFKRDSLKDQLLKPLLKQGLSHMDRIIFAAKGQEEHWIRNKIIRKEQCTFIMENSSSFRSMSRDACREITKLTGQPVFLWVGNLNTNKDPITVLGAFQKILQHYPQAKLYMIYRLNEMGNIVKQWISEHQLDKQVFLLGSKTREELKFYYNSADYFLSASHKEGSGYAAIEAMSCGVVPILTNIPSFVSLTDGGEVGALFDSGDSKMLCKKILEILEKPLPEEQSRVLAHFEKCFSAEAIAKQAIQMYQEVLTK